jgi:flagellar basal body-associated protein FliL
MEPNAGNDASTWIGIGIAAVTLLASLQGSIVFLIWRVGRWSQQMEGNDEKQTENTQRLTVIVEDHEERITSMEKYRGRGR